MDVVQKGKGSPELAIVAGIHGDEPAGVKAIKNILESDLDFEKPVKFIIANEEALEQNERYLDADLNRSFPGNPDSSLHEERLAAKIMDEIKDVKVLDIHTTHSSDRPFATTKDISESIELVKASGAENAIYFSNENGVLTEYINGIVLEAGLQGSDQAVENAEQAIKNFLAYFGAIDESYELSEPDFYKYYETVEGDWEFKAENFHKVEKGKVYAIKEGERLEASENFYPVLMSTNGYDGILGYKAEKIDL